MSNVSTEVEKIDEELDSFLRASACIDAINKALPKGKKQLAPIPKQYVFRKRDREVVSTMFHSVAELIGGAPRMAAWAAENPDKFYALYSKLLPSETETPVGGSTFIFQTAVPSNPLDNVSVDAAGRVFNTTLAPLDELPE